MKYRDKKDKTPQAILGIIIMFSIFMGLENISTSDSDFGNSSIQKKISSNYKNQSFIESINTEEFISFTDWCLNRDKLKQSTVNTIEELLFKVDTSDCNLANKRLLKIKHIGIFGKKDNLLTLDLFVL